MTTPDFDPTKKYRTRDGREFVFEGFDNGLVVGRVDDIRRYWWPDGRYYNYSDHEDHPIDLIEVTDEASEPLAFKEGDEVLVRAKIFCLTNQKIDPNGVAISFASDETELKSCKISDIVTLPKPLTDEASEPLWKKFGFVREPDIDAAIKWHEEKHGALSGAAPFSIRYFLEAYKQLKEATPRPLDDYAKAAAKAYGEAHGGDPYILAAHIAAARAVLDLAGVKYLEGE